MATITSAQAGNWSATTTWVGGVVPTAADDVVLNHVVTADVDFTVLSISRTSGSGSLSVTTSRNMTCTGAGILTAGATNSSLINITATTGQTVNLISTIINNIGGSGGNVAVLVNGLATVNIISNITASGGFNSHALNILGASSTVNITGNITNSITSASAWVVNINGAGSALTITGNVTAGGTVLASVVSTASSTLNINGIITGISSLPAVSSPSIVRVGGIINNTQTRMAIASSFVAILSTVPTQWVFQTENALVTKTLYDVNTLPTIPTVNNVRSGVSYASGALTGTLVVPPANAVTAGVTYDNGTVGTAQNTAASFLTALAASSDPLAVRLKNVATVQTTGDQIAAAL